jgi:hypothetical protein
MTLPDGYRFYAGRTFEVEFYVNPQGKMPAHDYYRSLTEDEGRRLLVIVGHFADAPFGTIMPKTLMNIEDHKAGIYAFKPSIHRFFNCFAKGRKIILLCAYKKQSKKMTQKDRLVLQSAIEMKEDYERRTKSGEYYD